MGNFHFRAFALGAIFAAAVVAQSGLAYAGTLGEAQQLVVAEATEKPAADGVIKSVNASDHKLTIKHGPIRALQMPGMTMELGVSSDIDLSNLAPGAKVRFTLGRDANGIFVIDHISRIK